MQFVVPCRGASLAAARCASPSLTRGVLNARSWRPWRENSTSGGLQVNFIAFEHVVQPATRAAVTTDFTTELPRASDVPSCASALNWCGTFAVQCNVARPLHFARFLSTSELRRTASL